MKKNFYENPLPREWREWLAELDRDPEQQRREAEQQAGLDLFQREWAMLQERYLERFVAANSNGVVADAADLDGLLDELKRRDIPLHDIAIEFVLSPETELIL